MYFSILNIDLPEMKVLLQSYIEAFDCSDKEQPLYSTRRACALALARDILARNHILSVETAKLTTIEHYESGEPYLKIPGENVPRLHISISHSGPWIACHISTETPVGIDIEDLTIKRNFLKLAEHFFSAYEFDYVKEHGIEGFYKIWTAKEAIAKLQGKGLSEVLKIQIPPSSLDGSIVSLNGSDYHLMCKITQEYIYTVATRGDIS